MKAGWEIKPLGEVAKTSSGGTPKKGNKDFYEGGDIPWLVSGEVANSNITSAKHHITSRGLAGSSAKIFPVNSVLVAMYGATAGEVGLLRFEAATNQAVCAVLPNDNYIPEYLYYCLLNEKAALISLAVGNAQPNISQAKIKALPIPLPPLEEQKRIVAVLDAAFEGLTRARTHIETNLQNARELFESYRDCHLGGSDLQPLSDYLEKITYGFTNPMPNSDDGPFKITAKNVINGSIDFGTARHTTQEAYDNLLSAKSKPRIGDVLLTKDGTLGRTAVVDQEGLCVNQSVAVLTPKTGLLPNYLHEILSCRVNQDAMIADAGGATIKHLYITRVPKIPVFIPSIDEQEKLLTKLREFQSDALNCVRHYAAKLQDLDDLRQSLLQKAFAGELT